MLVGLMLMVWRVLIWGWMKELSSVTGKLAQAPLVKTTASEVSEEMDIVQLDGEGVVGGIDEVGDGIGVWAVRGGVVIGGDDAIGDESGVIGGGGAEDQAGVEGGELGVAVGEGQFGEGGEVGGVEQLAGRVGDRGERAAPGVFEDDIVGVEEVTEAADVIAGQTGVVIAIIVEWRSIFGKPWQRVWRPGP